MTHFWVANHLLRKAEQNHVLAPMCFLDVSQQVIRTGQQNPFGLWWSEETSLVVESSSAPVAGEEPSSGRFGDALGGPLRGQKSERGRNVFKLCSHKVVHMHAGRAGRVLLALAEDVMRPAEILSEASSTAAATSGGHDVGSLGRLHVVGFTAATKGNNEPLVKQLKTKCRPVANDEKTKNSRHKP